MQIEQFVQDAELLMAHGRHLSALSLMLLAVAGSSKRAAPKSSDREAFELFVGGRLRRLLVHNGIAAPDVLTRESGIRLHVPDGNGGKRAMDLSEVLYKLYRCNLVHEARLPEHVEFVDDGATRHEGCAINIQLLHDRIRVGHSLLHTLAVAVRLADCNAELYGRRLHILQPKHAGFDEARSSEELIARLSARQSPRRASEVTLARYRLMLSIVQSTDPSWLCGLSDEELSKVPLALHGSVLNGGAFSGLETAELSDETGHLTGLGTEMLLSIASQFQLANRSFTPA